MVETDTDSSSSVEFCSFRRYRSHLDIVQYTLIASSSDVVVVMNYEVQYLKVDNVREFEESIGSLLEAFHGTVSS